MTSPALKFGMPVTCQGTIILPIVRQFCGNTGNGIAGSVTLLALFIVRGPEIWFAALEEGCSPEDLLAAITP